MGIAGFNSKCGTQVRIRVKLVLMILPVDRPAAFSLEMAIEQLEDEPSWKTPQELLLGQRGAEFVEVLLYLALELGDLSSRNRWINTYDSASAKKF